MRGVGLVDAVRSFPPEPSGPAWFAGLTALTASSSLVAFRESVHRGRAESAQLSDLTSRPEKSGRAAQAGLAPIRYEGWPTTIRGCCRSARADPAIRAAGGTAPGIRSSGRHIAERKQARKQHLAAHAAAGLLRRQRRRFREALACDLLPAFSGPERTAGRAAPAMRVLTPRPAALQDCLAFEGEKVNVTCQPFEPRRLVAGAVSALAAGTPRPGCGIASVIAADVPRRVTGDAALLRQLIEGLAGPPLGDGNGICIRISAGAGRLRLSFEMPWPRAPGQNGEPGHLAVAAVRPVIEAMRGELAVHRRDGAASVRVEIPAPAAGETAGDAERGAADDRPSPGTSRQCGLADRA